MDQETLIKAVSLACLREMQLTHLDHRNALPGDIPGLTFCDINWFWEPLSKEKEW